MNSGSSPTNPAVVAAFKAALLHRGLIALLVFAVLVAAWVCLRCWLPKETPDDPVASGPAVWVGSEPAGRRLLRIGFGVLWLFDGILQAQPNMSTGLPSQVIEPVASASAPWVRHMVQWAQTIWINHPVQAATSAVWIEIGLGIWLLTAPRGTLSRLAGLVSVGWGLIVWVFGESFGGIFAPGLTWLTGAPGAVLSYVAAGTLIALPGRSWRSPRLGQLTLAGLGLFLAVMAGLQAQPSLGYWRGISYGQPGPLASMVQSMSQTPQPGFLSAWVSAFGAFDEAHGFAVNLFVVAALAATGAAFLSGRPHVIRPALFGFTVLCLADWVLIEDLGFLGGLGTDPNSMIPFIVLAAGGCLALTRPSPLIEDAAASEAAPAPAGAPSALGGWRSRVGPASLARHAGAASIRSVAALGAVGLIVLGTGPMAVAQTSPKAGPAQAVSVPAAVVPAATVGSG